MIVKVYFRPHYQLRYPNHVTLVRGNHESRQITQIYGFYDECIRKYGSPMVWRLCCDLFDYMSLGALIEQSYLGVHGGLSPSISSLDEVTHPDRQLLDKDAGPAAGDPARWPHVRSSLVRSRRQCFGMDIIASWSGIPFW